MRVTVGLQMRNAQALQNLVQSQATPGSPDFNKYITPAQFVAGYAPTTVSVKAVSDYLAAAGLDVYRKEPDFDLRLRELPNLFLTPHMGSATMETRTAMGMRALDNIAAVLGSRQPIDPVLVH